MLNQKTKQRLEYFFWAAIGVFFASKAATVGMSFLFWQDMMLSPEFIAELSKSNSLFSVMRGMYPVVLLLSLGLNVALSSFGFRNFFNAHNEALKNG